MVPGIVYLSKIPRDMSPDKVTELLEQFGSIGRVYLHPESSARYKERVSRGGRPMLQYEEGWVEFLEKSAAKKCALLLNNSAIGGKKNGNRWRDELWNIRYLAKFTWNDLTGFKFMKEVTKQKRVQSEIVAMQRATTALMEELAVKKIKKKRKIQLAE